MRLGRVIDGDSLVLADGTEVRTLGIDTPERGHALHAGAARLHRQLLEAGPLVLVTTDPPARDRHGRSIGLIGLAPPDSALPPRIAALELLSRGLATIYIVERSPLLEAVLPAFLEAQRRAMASRSGLWSNVTLDGPRRFRATRHRFHEPDCRHLSAARQAEPVSAREAYSAGKSACRTCLPR